jgi:hypothetical protein
MRGGDMQRAADRLRFPRTDDLPTRYHVGERIRIYWHEQRAWLTEPVQFIEISLYPRAVRYRFNYLYNRRRVTLWATEAQLMEWNAPPPPKAAPLKSRKRPDRFSCEWGTCRLDIHPDIPARWAARHIPTGAAICLPAVSQSTAHERFTAFMAWLDKMHPLTEADRAVKLVVEPIAIAKKQVNLKNNTKTGINRHDAPKQRQPRQIREMPRLRVRKVAA